MKKHRITNEDFSMVIGNFLDKSKESRLEALIAVTGLLKELENSQNYNQLVRIASTHLTARGYSQEKEHFKDYS